MTQSFHRHPQRVRKVRRLACEETRGNEGALVVANCVRPQALTNPDIFHRRSCRQETEATVCPIATEYVCYPLVGDGKSPMPSPGGEGGKNL